MQELRTAVVSSKSAYCRIDKNLAHFTDIVRKVAAKGVRFVCFPELSLSSYSLGPQALEIAQPVPGPATDALEKVAKEFGAYLSVGLPEKARGKFHITQAVIGPKGYLGKYRKRHPTAQEIGAGFSPGLASPTFNIDGFKLGLNICFDGRHMDTIEAMRKAGVDIIHHPHGNGLGLGRDAEKWTRGKLSYCAQRAIHARAWLLINNSASDTRRPGGVLSFGSGAMVIDPLGQAVARTTQRTRSEKLVIVTLVKPLSHLIPEFELKRLWEPASR